MEFSRYQTAVFDEVETGRDNVIVQAVAGSGKSTTIKEAQRRFAKTNPNKTSIVMAFNASIAKAMNESGVNATTLNSLGHRAWMRSSEVKIVLDRDKTRSILKDVLASKRDAALYWTQVSRMVALAKSQGLVPRSVARGLQSLTPDTDEAWWDIIQNYDIQFSGTFQGEEADPYEAIGFARKALAKTIQMKGLIDFDDQLYMTVIHGIPVPTYDLVFVDETQDLNLIQRALIRMAVKKGGRIVAVGDRAQAIYAWRGADSRSMDAIKEEFNCKELPLSICYRCSAAVIAEAQKTVSYIEAAPNAPEGQVISMTKYGPKTFGPTDWILCRNNAPLVNMAYKLIGSKVPVRMLGRDLVQGLTTILRKLQETYVKSGSNEKEIIWLSEHLGYWVERETQKALAAEKEDLAQKISDRYETIKVFIENSEVETIDALIGEIEELFSTENLRGQMLTLSSIHRAKGAEAPRVFFLDRHLLPSGYARSAEAQQQEQNLIYVGVTRAIDTLAYVDTDGYSGSLKAGAEEITA